MGRCKIEQLANDFIFQLRRISKHYTDKSYNIQVLEALDFNISSGETVAITGSSGSGKSTLLHILGLLDTPTAGQLYFRGEEIGVHTRNIEGFRNRHIGFVFQFHYLLADFTATENVAMPLVIAGKGWKAAIARAKELLVELDLEERLSHYPNQLSGGEQQRVAIARAIINEPDIIIADEPTGNLDRLHANEIIRIFERINSEHGQTIVLATHDVDLAQRMKKHYHLADYKLNLDK